MGNPHVVLFGPEPADDDRARASGPGSSVRSRTGPTWNSSGPVPATGELTLRVWERGVGETLACGTGTCAAAAAAHAHGDVGTRVRVHNPGGPSTSSSATSGVFLAGPTQKVGDVMVDESRAGRLVRSSEAGPEPVAGPLEPGTEAVATEVATRQ